MRPPHELVWSGSFGSLVTGVRTQSLTHIGPNRTRYTSSESFTGPLGRYRQYVKQFYPLG